MPDGERSPTTIAWHQKRRQVAFLWPLAVLLVLALGIWGFASLAPADTGRLGPPPLPVLEVVYRTARLFTLNLDVPDGAVAPWPLWVAAFAAPLLTLRGIAELFREQLTGRLVRYFVTPRVVIFGANERCTALINASDPPGRWRDAIVVVDPDAQALAMISGPRVWTVRGDGRTTDSLTRAALGRTANVVVVTGDNARNSVITTAILDLEPAPELALYVEVEEPGLARTLEQGGQRAGVETTTFSAAGLAATGMLDELAAAGEPSLLAADPDGSPSTVALFGTGALVEAVVLELHRRRRVQLLDDPDARLAVPRILLFGPDASERSRALATFMGTELQLLDIDPLDVDLDQVVELDAETARHLGRHRPLRRVLVLTPTDLDGGGIAITLARHLGRGATIEFVTEARTTPFGNKIQEQSHDSATLAEVRVFRAPDLAYDLAALQAERVVDRLGRALYEVDHRDGPPWSTVADRRPYLDAAREAARGGPAGPTTTTAPGSIAAARAALRRTALISLDPPELAPLEALGFRSPTALARSGLGVDFHSLTALVPAGRKLLDDGNGAAFGVWAEVARLRIDAAELDRDLPQSATGPRIRDVRKLLLLRRTLLGSSDARLALLGEAADAIIRRPAGDPRNPIVLLAGATESPQATAARLEPTLAHLPSATTVWAAAPVAALLESPPLTLRSPAHAGDGPADLLALWQHVLAGGHHAADVRVLALPGTTPDDLLLCRALGATIGRIETPAAPDLNRMLLNGAGQIVPLPDDRMTVRAFLRPSLWPQALDGKREPLARELHQRYVIRHRPRKGPEDPALRSWPVLSSWLKLSNYAVVDDIPTKLAVLGLRLEERPARPPDADLTAAFTENIELLAEMEHGRFTSERLLSGWTSGVRDPARFVSPHLRPWTELHEEAKEFDREVMRDLPELLAQQGLGVRPIPG